jgi:peptide/nickel transport system substrate-binding protein
MTVHSRRYAMNSLFTSVFLAASFALIAGAASADDLAIGLAAEPTTIDPHYISIAPNVSMGRNIFDHLVNPDAAYQMKPGLAVSWKALDDTTWEFKLRQGVKWHDGSPFTADDVISTFARLPTAGLGQFGPYTRGREVSKIDDYTILIKTKGPDPLVPNNMAAFAIISKRHGEGAKAEDYNSGKATIGTGPHKFVEWISGDRLVLEGNPDYWGGKPKWNRVVFKPIKAGPSRVAALLAGEVKMIDYVPTTDIGQLRKNPNIVISQKQSARVIFWAPDVARDISPYVRTNEGALMFPNPLRDWRVRKAISLAIDRKAIVERVMDNNAVAASQMLAKGFFGFNPNLSVESFDLEGAKKLLAEAGYKDGFRLTIHGPNDRYDNDSQVAEAVAQMVAKIGIRAEVETMPKAVYFGRQAKNKFSFNMTANGSRTGEASVPLQAFYHSTWPETGMGIYNFTGYSNPRINPIIEKARVTVDDAEREKLFHQAMEIGTNDLAFIMSHYQVNTWALQKGYEYDARIDEFTLAQGVTKTR